MADYALLLSPRIYPSVQIEWKSCGKQQEIPGVRTSQFIISDHLPIGATWESAGTWESPGAWEPRGSRGAYGGLGPAVWGKSM